MSWETDSTDRTGLEVAVIGMAARFPGAETTEDFWRNLHDGVESVTLFTDDELAASEIDREVINDSRFVKARAVRKDIDLFDASFFGYSPREAEIIDPQQRHFLECAWQALEDAGYVSEAYPGRIGVYAGSGATAYYMNNLLPNRDIRKSLSLSLLSNANEKDYLPMRVSYKLNLSGPSVCIQTTCSTSLVAVHMACQALLSGDCEMALAGGVTIVAQAVSGYFYEEGGILSPDGHCRAFDAKAAGIVPGSGVGVIVLKKLEDAINDGDYIHAIIRGSAINNDGSLKVSFTAPSEERQMRVIREAQVAAEVEPETITYIETHGTGTILGDPIEIAGLTAAFRLGTTKKNFCAIGSVKTNIGHLDTAAGIAGLIKTVLALEHKMVPPSLHFENPNPNIDFESSPFYVNTRLTEWEANGIPRRAGVSSFGMGGANAHVILEEAPRRKPSGPSRPNQLLMLSAKSTAALERMTKNLADYLKHHEDSNLADAAYTLQVGRRAFSHRRILVCSRREDAAAVLEEADSQRIITSCVDSNKRPVTFMFPGQGAQYINMGLDLYHQETIFRDQIDHCSEFLIPHLQLDLRKILYPSGEYHEGARCQLTQTYIAQAVLFIVEFSLAKLWMSWGIKPQAMIGHSIGEYVAACLAGVLTLEEALALVAARGKLMQTLAEGAMLAVPLPEPEVEALIGNELSLAAINAPSLCVVSGQLQAVKALEALLDREGVSVRRLHTSHAFHSRMMDPILDAFTNLVKGVSLKPPKIPYISNVTGRWVTESETIDASYWARHLRQTVRFADGMSELLKESEMILLEVGPGKTLSNLAKRLPNKSDGHKVISSLPSHEDRNSAMENLIGALGHLWAAGRDVDWAGFYAGEHRHRLPLPAYSFDRKRYWVEAPKKFKPAKVSRVEMENTSPDQTRERDSDVIMSTLTGERKEAQGGADKLKNSGIAANKHPRPELKNDYVPPRNELERSVAFIWQDLFNIERLGVYDNFFDLGGDSFMALTLNAKLFKAFQVKLGLHTLLEDPTIADLAKLIEISRPKQNYSYELTERALPPRLVEFQRGGSGRTLFLVHPGGGGVFGYRDLAKSLGPDLSVYGVQAKGLENGEEPFNRIEDMAAHYLDAVRFVQPQGPYLLGGLSFGGVVAFEMAQQLVTFGEKVNLLALFDSPDPSQMGVSWNEDGELLAILANKSALLEPDEFQQLGLDLQADNSLKEIKTINKGVINKLPEQTKHLVRVWKMNAEALRNYRLRLYPGQIVFFRARERSSWLPLHPELPWIEVAEEGVNVQIASGGHATMLAPPHVQRLADILKRCWLN